MPIFVIFVILSYLSYLHLIAMDLILLRVPLAGNELSSDEDEPPLHSEDPADGPGGSALDDMQPQIGPPIQQKPPAPTPFDFAAFIMFYAPFRREYIHIIGHNTRS